MLKSYLRTAFRNLARNKLHAAINVSGLAIGMACCLLLLLHVQNELAYDRFHERHQQIYRLYQINRDPSGHEWTRSLTGSAPGHRLKSDFPQIDAVVRFIGGRRLIEAGGKKIYEDRVFYADGEVFDVFSFKLVKGDPATALTEPYTITISESTARKYFGKTDPMGQSIKIENSAECKITGVFEDVPQPSHLKFDFLASFQTLTSRNPSMNDEWYNITRTYVLLSDGANPRSLESEMPAFVRKYHDEKTAASLNYGLQPLADVHLNPTSVDLDETADASRLYLFGALAAFILFIALVNFINLSTAQYARRVDEVSVRKVLGATGDQIRQQFMAESMVLVLTAAAVSLVVVELFLPAFRIIAQSNLQIHFSRNPVALFGLAIFTILVGLAGGFYPALVLSRHNPVDILRKTFRSGRGGVFMRRALVIFQFAISAALILSTIVVYKQYSFLSTKDLGFDTANLVKIPVERSVLGRLPGMKARLSELPGVSGVTASTYGSDYGFNVEPEGAVEALHMIAIFVDRDFVNTMGLKIIQGGDFSAGYGSDQSNAIIFNRRAIDIYGDDLAVGKNVVAYAGRRENAGPNTSKTVVGIVEDFHFRNISEFRMQPVVLVIDPSRVENLLVRIGDNNPAGTLASIRNVHSQFVPDRPFEFRFLEDEMRQALAGELRQSALLGYSCLLAVFVALIGLFGLALHATRQRTKEIGIRKVCGASSGRIIYMLTTEFLLLVAAANLVALPLAYYFLSEWLSHYPYRVDLGPLYFALAVLTSMALAFLTVGFQSFKSAGANPVDALRYE